MTLEKEAPGTPRSWASDMLIFHPGYKMQYDAIMLDSKDTSTSNWNVGLILIVLERDGSSSKKSFQVMSFAQKKREPTWLPESAFHVENSGRTSMEQT